MLSSQVSAFTNPIEYQEAIRAADVTVVPTDRGDFRAELTRVDFHRLWMQRFVESAPVVKFTALHRQRSIIVFLTEPNQPDIHHGGVEVSPDDIAVYRLGASVHHRTSAPCRFGSMSLAPDDLARISYVLVGRELAAPLDTFRMRPTPHLLVRLRLLHAAAGRVAANTPDVLRHLETSRSLEESLIQALIRCLTGGERLEADRRFRNHKGVMTRLEDFLGTHPDRPLYLSEICAAANTSEHTVRICCQEHLGMGPVRYLWLRRMHLARRALNQANSWDATVTSIAMAHGFWELGRFSVAYRGLFGETPVATLRRPADEAPASRDSRPLPVFCIVERSEAPIMWASVPLQGRLMAFAASNKARRKRLHVTRSADEIMKTPDAARWIAFNRRPVVRDPAPETLPSGSRSSASKRLVEMLVGA